MYERVSARGEGAVSGGCVVRLAFSVSRRQQSDQAILIIGITSNHAGKTVSKPSTSTKANQLH